MNREYLIEQLSLMEDYIARAKSVSRRTKREFLEDKILVDAAIRELTVLFETAHNIAKHLISTRGWREAASKAEAFEILAEEGVLPKGLCDAFRRASRFRNLVTYQSAVVEDEIVYRDTHGASRRL